MASQETSQPIVRKVEERSDPAEHGISLQRVQKREVVLAVQAESLDNMRKQATVCIEHPKLIARVEQLKREGQTLAQIADALNSEGFRPVKRTTRFTRSTVCQLMRRERERLGVQRKSPRDQNQLRKNEWWLPDLAMHPKKPVTTMHRWHKVGWVSAWPSRRERLWFSPVNTEAISCQFKFFEKNEVSMIRRFGFPSYHALGVLFFVGLAGSLLPAHEITGELRNGTKSS